MVSLFQHFLKFLVLIFYYTDNKDHTAAIDLKQQKIIAPGAIIFNVCIIVVFISHVLAKLPYFERFCAEILHFVSNSHSPNKSPIFKTLA